MVLAERAPARSSRRPAAEPVHAVHAPRGRRRGRPASRRSCTWTARRACRPSTATRSRSSRALLRRLRAAHRRPRPRQHQPQHGRPADRRRRRATRWSASAPRRSTRSRSAPTWCGDEDPRLARPRRLDDGVRARRATSTSCPLLPDRGPDGRGRAQTYAWPEARARGAARPALADEELDVVILQRPQDVALADALARPACPGRDLPAVWVEHNAPQGRVAEHAAPAGGSRRPDDRARHALQRPVLGLRRHADHASSSTASSTRRRATRASCRGRRSSSTRRGGADASPAPTSSTAICGDVPWDLFGIDSRRARRRRRPAARRPARASWRGAASTSTRTAGRASGCRCSRPCTSRCPSSPLATTEAHDAVPPACGVVSNRLRRPARGRRAARRRPRRGARASARPRARTRCGATGSSASWRTGTRCCTRCARWRRGDGCERVAA